MQFKHSRNDSRYLSTISDEFKWLDTRLCANSSAGIHLNQETHIALSKFAISERQSGTTKKAVLILGGTATRELQGEDKMRHTTLYFPVRDGEHYQGTAFVSHTDNPRVLPFALDLEGLTVAAGVYQPRALFNRRLLSWAAISKKVSDEGNGSRPPSTLPGLTKLQQLWKGPWFGEKEVDSQFPWKKIPISALTKSQMLQVMENTHWDQT